MTDYYLENPERLKNQPKRTIADYVEQNGILVPTRFDSLKEAQSSGKHILLRSEHPQEYDGVSGLLDSFGLNSTCHFGGWKPGDLGFTPQGKETIEEIKQTYFQSQEESPGEPRFTQYCNFLNLDEEKFKEQFSFSIWEKITGFNRTVVADSAIAGRYHVMTCDEENHFRNYAIVENGVITSELVMPLTPELKKGMTGLIKTYEAVQNLDRFDSHHCPIMEFQTTHDEQNYFLQYHRTRDFSPVDFTLQRSLEEGEAEVLFVRGGTPKEGIVCKVTVQYGGIREWNFDADNEDGSYDFHWNQVWPELMVRKRKVQMIDANNLNFSLDQMVINHIQKSKLFKPQVSIIHKLKDILSDDKDCKQGKNSYLDLHITSDGRRAFVKRV